MNAYSPPVRKPPFEVTSDLIRRFDGFVRKSAAGCWEWVGEKSAKGYGHFTIRVGGAYITYRAHRVSYRLATGVQPGELLVCHHCDNPGCVRPDHLFLGTNADNTADRVRKGRTSRLIGVNNPEAKLTPEAVREIRQSALTVTEEAARQGVSRRSVMNVRNGLTWRHVQ